MAQDQWIVKNETNRYLSVGDLPKLPALWPNKVVNVLNYYEQDAVSNSAAMKQMLNMGWLTLTKIKNNSYEQFDSSNDADEAITTAEMTDVDGSGGGGPGGGLENIVEDTSPQLGGNLDLNGFNVGSADAGDLTKLSNITVSSTELNYTDGVTSNIQTQLDAKLSSGGALKTAVNTITATSYTALTTDHNILVDDATAGSAVTVTLPAASGNAGLQYNIKKLGNTANVIVDGDGSETIDGGTTATLTVQYESITIVCDGSNWWIV